MLDITHREAPDPGTGWVFECDKVSTIYGGARTEADCVAAADHCARQYLSRVAGYDVALEDASRLVRHTRRVQAWIRPAARRLRP